MGSNSYIRIANRDVCRIGFGTMQLTGDGYWGNISINQRKNAIRIIRTAYDLGVNHFDTADAYGPHLAEELIRAALHPYNDDMLIATKGGFTRQGPGLWKPVGRPEYLQQCVELSLRRLGMEQIPLYYLHRIDSLVPLEEQLGVLELLRIQGKIGEIGISKVNIEEIIKASAITKIAAVQNKLNLLDSDIEVVKYCELKDIPFVAYSPFASGKIFKPPSHKAEKKQVTARSALLWILSLSPNVAVIPSTKSETHLKQIL